MTTFLKTKVAEHFIIEGKCNPSSFELVSAKTENIKMNCFVRTARATFLLFLEIENVNVVLETVLPLLLTILFLYFPAK